jgi:hypothetical protein
MSSLHGQAIAGPRGGCCQSRPSFETSRFRRLIRPLYSPNRSAVCPLPANPERPAACQRPTDPLEGSSGQTPSHNLRRDPAPTPDLSHPMDPALEVPISHAPRPRLPARSSCSATNEALHQFLALLRHHFPPDHRPSPSPFEARRVATINRSVGLSDTFSSTAWTRRKSSNPTASFARRSRLQPSTF